MDDRDFFDLLLQQFARTTGAADTFWMPKEYTDNPGKWAVFAVDKDDSWDEVATVFSEVDADFITAVHGCFPDLVRRLHAALDEADRLDLERDEAEQRVFSLVVENEELKTEVERLLRREAQLEHAFDMHDKLLVQAKADRDSAKAELSYHRPLG